MDNSPNKRKYSGFPSPRDWFSSGARLASWEDLKTSSGSFSDVEPDDLGRALRVVRRAAAIDTGAIEALYEVNRGVTMTIAIESKLWETYLPDKPAVQSLIEAQLQAYERLIDIIKGPGPLTEAVVRKLHQEVCKHQDTYTAYTQQGPQQQELKKGEYKQQPNNVTSLDGSVFEYSPAEEVGIEMSRLLTS